MAELLERRELLATFQQGDIVVEVVGDGSNPLTNTGNAIFLDEYQPNDGPARPVDSAAGPGHQL